MRDCRMIYNCFLRICRKASIRHFYRQVNINQTRGSTLITYSAIFCKFFSSNLIRPSGLPFQTL
uniref:Uncharacterized protein n=1 Tax=Arundo donax TaxID=35708 RepID=A0A0A9CI94_ARUDO